MKKTIWVFARDQHGMVKISEPYEIPAHFEDGGKSWIREKKFKTQWAIFPKGTKTLITTDADLAKGIMEHKYFKTTKNKDGSIWLVSEDVIEKEVGEPIVEPAPEPIPTVLTVQEAKGTGSNTLARARAKRK